MKTKSKKDKWLSTGETALILKCHRKTVIRMLKRGELEGGKFGPKHYRFSESSVKNYMALKVQEYELSHGI